MEEADTIRKIEGTDFYQCWFGGSMIHVFFEGLELHCYCVGYDGWNKDRESVLAAMEKTETEAKYGTLHIARSLKKALVSVV